MDSQKSYPVSVDIGYPATQSRALALFSIPFFLIRILMLIPHVICLYVLQIAGLIAAWINQFCILFTGKGSKGLHEFAVGTIRWSTRVSVYMYGLTDKYPPFKLDN